MKLSAILEPLIAAGVPGEVILATVRAYENAHADALEKRRESDRIRQAKKRERGTMSRDSRDVTVTVSSRARVEDSSSKEVISGEDKKEDAAPSARPKATRIPDDFVPDETWATGNGLTPPQARIEAQQFVDFWRSKPGKDGTKLDWPATWRNWVRNAVKRQPVVRSGAPPPKPLTQGESLRNMARQAGIIDDTGTPVRRLEASDRDGENPGVGDVIRLAVAGNNRW